MIFEMLSFNMSGDISGKVMNRKYVLGFILTTVAVALYGFIVPLIELTYKKTK